MKQVVIFKKKVKSKPKKRVNFDSFFKEQEDLILKMSLKELRQYKEDLKNQLSTIHNFLREKGVKESRIAYLRGKRKFITFLLTAIKKRIKIINVSIHSGTNIEIARRFFNIAAEELPMDMFQKILGLALTNQEEVESTIDSVRQFMQEAKDKVK